MVHKKNHLSPLFIYLFIYLFIQTPYFKWSSGTHVYLFCFHDSSQALFQVFQRGLTFVEEIEAAATIATQRLPRRLCTCALGNLTLYCLLIVHVTLAIVPTLTAGW